MHGSWSNMGEPLLVLCATTLSPQIRRLNLWPLRPPRDFASPKSGYPFLRTTTKLVPPSGVSPNTPATVDFYIDLSWSLSHYPSSSDADRVRGPNPLRRKGRSFLDPLRTRTSRNHFPYKAILNKIFLSKIIEKKGAKDRPHNYSCNQFP